jgi:uncharacterized protein with beta-barrel porin domain
VVRLVIARGYARGVEFSGNAWRWQFRLRVLLLAGAAAAVVRPEASFAQNLIQNPGFETNSLVDWTHSPSVDVESNGAFAITAFGNYYANPYGAGPDTLSQTVTLTKGGKYDFAFFYATRPGFTYNLTASVDGTTVFSGHISTNGQSLESMTTLQLPAGATAVTFTATEVCGGLRAEMGIDDVSLILMSPTALTLPSGTPANQTNTANALNSFLNTGATLPANFQNLFNLSGSQLQTALTQLDGEASTDAEKGVFKLMNQFMGLMLDPFAAGRAGSLNGNSIGFAPEQQASLPPDIAEAYASVLKAPPMAPPPTQQWTAWGSGFGASSTTNGNASVGSNNVTATDYGFAGGMDYHFTPDTLAGFALAGAGTTWNLAQGLGGGHSDAFQAGVYDKSYYGPAYVAGALAFANNWFTTDRAALGDQLRASFNGQSYGGRFESGYRYGLPASGGAIGATPYAAIQTQWFHTPTYSETDLAGGGLGLTYNAMTANDTRSELGARFDDVTAFNGMPLVLNARLAWAHDWVTSPTLDAVFQSLPGTSFVVNGATPPANSALVSAGGELHMTAHWSLAAKFDGEFANGSQTYGGTGTLRYTW